MSQLDERVELFVRRARRLYSLPVVALRVLELTNQPTIDSHAMAEAIENDPALSAKILRTVNSSLYGLNQPVADLTQAIAMLGMKPLKLLVLGFSLPGSLCSPGSAAVLRRYWQHSVFASIAAREMAETWFSLPEDDCFVGGLLQDLGILVLIQDLGDSYERFLTSVWEQGTNLHAEEVRVLGFDHKVLTGQLLRQWHLPPHLVAAIEQPFDIEQLAQLSGAERLAQVLHLAYLVACFLLDKRAESLDAILRTGKRYCDLQSSQLEALMTVLEQKSPALAEILSLELPDHRNYSELMHQAHQRLLHETDELASLWRDGPLRPGDLLSRFDEVHDESRPTGGVLSPMDSSESRILSKRGTCSGRPRFAAARSKELDATQQGLVAAIAAEVSRCRKVRSSATLMLVELDQLNDGTTECQQDVEMAVVRQLGVALQEIVGDAGVPLEIENGRFAVLLRGVDRPTAVELAWRTIDGVRHWPNLRSGNSQVAVSVSIGLATLSMAPRNFPAEEMLIAAERCLTGVRLSGGDGVKSIDIY